MTLYVCRTVIGHRLFSFSSGKGSPEGNALAHSTYGALRNKYSVLDFALLIFLSLCAIIGQSLFRAATLHPLS